MKNQEQEIDPDRVDDVFSKIQNSNNKQSHQKPQKVHKMIIQSDQDDDDAFMNALQERGAKSAPQTAAGKDLGANTGRKRAPQTQMEPQILKEESKIQMEIQPKRIKKLSFGQLQQEVKFYLTDVYQFHFYKLFITGVMQNGQTINLVANRTLRQLYFALKKQQFENEQLSQQFLDKAQKEIKNRLYKEGINDYVGEFQKRKYVFEIDGVCRSQRPYYKVRYSFQKKELPTPDWQGEFFKFVFGTTYTPLQLFIINTGIKGPCWVKIDKDQLRQNQQSKKYTQGSLCAQIISNAQFIEVVKQNTKPPCLRVMSLSVKSVIPSHLSKKQLFPNSARIDQTHIYCISYALCDQYQVELKPPKYNTVQKTYFLQSFGAFKEKNSHKCETEMKMIGQFIADLNLYDPDVIVCHDASKIIDVLIQRMAQLGDKNYKPILGRLIHQFKFNSSNQYQRINNSLAGRLLVDTFIHSKDMIKSIDYELQSMSRHIKPQKKFSGMSDEQVKDCLNNNRTFQVFKLVMDQADTTLALMNHLQVLQLSRQLSNICGNLWKRSLQNQRAQRNEFLIMHQCKRRELIIPDKFKISKNQDQDQDVDRKKYTGGMVIQPKKGMYNDFIILLDFNSLYPSIIRQYNVCFSVLERPRLPLTKFYKSKKNPQQNKKNNKMELQGKQGQNIKNQKNQEQAEINPPPKDQCTRQKWGFLPLLIDGIVNQRQKCKKAMKTASVQKCIILDIQQKSYKIVANSIYGCLGFSVSRFYSKPMAALITRMGREALQRANDIVTARGGVQVIYGDTDSLMIQPTSLNKQTDKQKLFEIKSLADDLKKLINKEYTNLQIDIDGIFKPIILLMKKKYVANKLQNFQKIIFGLQQEPKFHLQYKGIQVVRRDNCEVARSSLKKILQILMNSKKTDVFEIYEEIYDYAKTLKEALPQLSHKQFLFSKQLNKKPKQYANAQTIAHVKVALDRIKNGQKEETLVNHTIYYIVCKPKLKSQDCIAKLCFDDRAFQRSQKYSTNPQERLQIDFDYYKQEIIQPWMRIFIHLQEFNIDKLFEAFDVKDADRKKIKKQMSSERQQVDNGLQDFLTNDMKQKSKKLNEEISGITCSNCQNILQFSEDGEIRTKCKYCPFDNTKQMMCSLSNKLSMWIKQKTSLYYSNKQKCQGCQKVYHLSLISRCCRVQHQTKTKIPFEIHSFIYLVKELVDITLVKLQQKFSSNKKQFTQQGMRESFELTMNNLKNINQTILQKYLKESDYQNINGIFDMFRN